MKLEKNVTKFLSKSCDTVAEQTRFFHWNDIVGELRGSKITSPIEQLFYIALETARKLENILEDELEIQPQFKINKYRVDFLITRHSTTDSEFLVIECDSQEWHERTEKERRYEKQRDRYIVTKGFKVLRYTGKEIIDNPFKVVEEVINHLFGGSCDWRDWDFING